MTNPFLSESDSTLCEIFQDIQMSKQKGCRAERLVPYAKNLYNNINSPNNELITLRECLDVAKSDFFEAMGVSFLKLVHHETPQLVKQASWSPDTCPNCDHELSESLGDGYYSHPTFLTRCPECGQKLFWNAEDK